MRSLYERFSNIYEKIVFLLKVYIFIENLIIMKAFRNLIIYTLLLASTSIDGHAQSLTPGKDLHFTAGINTDLKPDNLKNKYILLDFWATWCAPCLEGMPHINSLQKKFSQVKDLYFLSITDEHVGKAKPIVERFSFETHAVSDSTGNLHKIFDIKTLPTAILLDRKGTVKWKGNPKDITSEMLEALINNQDITVESTKIQSINSEPPAIASVRNTNLGGQVEKAKEMAAEFMAIYNNPSIIEYLFLERSTSNNFSKSFSYKHQDSRFTYKLAVPFRVFAAELMGISTSSIELSDSLENLKVDYCYKGGNRYLDSAWRVDALLNKLNIQMDSNLHTVEVFELGIFDNNLIQTSLNKNKNGFSRTSSSDGHQIIAVDNVPLRELADVLQDNFGNYFRRKGILNDSKYDLVLKASDLMELKKSLGIYGISLDSKLEKVNKFRFSEGRNKL